MSIKKRVIVFGATGFVGSHILKTLNPAAYEGIPVSRKDCDLADEACRPVIGNLVRDGDVVVCAAAKAPAKNFEMLLENIALITHLVQAIRGKRLAYVLNISSDAVYADSMGKLTESSLIAPMNAHGIMHAMRETILEKNLAAPIGHLRPTLIYGPDDPHNGYGPNAFLRNAKAHKRIELFGNGEEQRDHIFVEDVAKLACSMIDQNTPHAVNAVTGETISFMEIAELIRANDASVEIGHKPRSGPMPHNGYRAFSNDAAKKLCPALQCKNMGSYICEIMEPA